MNELDRLMARSKNKKKLALALQRKFDKDPVGFFKGFIMPLLPKESKVAVESDGIVEWKSLLEAFPKPETAALPPKED